MYSSTNLQNISLYYKFCLVLNAENHFLKYLINIEWHKKHECILFFAHDCIYTNSCSMKDPQVLTWVKIKPRPTHNSLVKIQCLKSLIIGYVWLVVLFCYDVKKPLPQSTDNTDRSPGDTVMDKRKMWQCCLIDFSFHFYWFLQQGNNSQFHSTNIVVNFLHLLAGTPLTGGIISRFLKIWLNVDMRKPILNGG